jgi:hypothetical protein
MRWVFGLNEDESVYSGVDESTTDFQGPQVNVYTEEPVHPPPPYAQVPIGADLFGRINTGLILLLVGWLILSVNYNLGAVLANDVLRTAGTVLKVLGLFLIALFLFRGALQFHGLSDRIRMGMLIAAGLVVGLTF